MHLLLSLFRPRRTPVSDRLTIVSHPLSSSTSPCRQRSYREVLLSLPNSAPGIRLHVTSGSRSSGNTDSGMADKANIKKYEASIAKATEKGTTVDKQMRHFLMVITERVNSMATAKQVPYCVALLKGRAADLYLEEYNKNGNTHLNWTAFVAFLKATATGCQLTPHDYLENALNLDIFEVSRSFSNNNLVETVDAVCNSITQASSLSATPFNQCFMLLRTMKSLPELHREMRMGPGNTDWTDLAAMKAHLLARNDLWERVLLARRGLDTITHQTKVLRVEPEGDVTYSRPRANPPRELYHPAPKATPTTDGFTTVQRRHLKAPRSRPNPPDGKSKPFRPEVDIPEHLRTALPPDSPYSWCRPGLSYDQRNALFTKDAKGKPKCFVCGSSTHGHTTCPERKAKFPHQFFYYPKDWRSKIN